MRAAFLLFLSLSGGIAASMIAGCTEPTAAASGAANGAEDGDVPATSDGGANGPADGATQTDGGAPTAKEVKLGPEVNLASGGAISIYGAWKDKVVYVVFDTTAKTYRVELARAAGAQPKVLLQGTITRFESYMFASGSADVARDKLVPGTGTNGATFVVAAPTGAGNYEIHAIDAAAETSTKIDAVPYIGKLAHRNGFVFYWYSQQVYTSTAYSGPAALAWRAPDGTIARVPKAWQTPEDVVEVSPDGAKVAYLAEASTGNPFPPFETSTLALANANGAGVVTLGSATSSFVFHGSSLLYGGVSVASPGAAPKELFRPTGNGAAGYDWWIGNDALNVVERTKPNLLTVLPLAGGGRATIGVERAALRTGKRVFYIPTGTSDLQIADAVVPVVPKFTVPDVVEPFVTEDGRWAALLRGPNTAKRVDRVWSEGKIVDLGDKALGHYDDVNGFHPIASGAAACINTIFDAVCVTSAGVVSKVRSDGAYFVSAVGANGLLYTSYPASETKPRIASLVVQGSTLANHELTKSAVGGLRVSESAIFYLVSNGATATLAGRTTQ